MSANSGTEDVEDSRAAKNGRDQAPQLLKATNRNLNSRAEYRNSYRDYPVSVRQRHLRLSYAFTSVAAEERDTAKVSCTASTAPKFITGNRCSAWVSVASTDAEVGTVVYRERCLGQAAWTAFSRATSGDGIKC
jgi:hypothetical protein